MSIDRELLELAAKAAGIPLDEWGEDWKNDNGVTYGDGFVAGKRPGFFLWNPLTDDGDALRLAVKLKIEVAQEVFSKSRVDARSPRGKWLWEMYEDHGDDGQKAARHAIVRAAAEIGRAMP